MTAKKAQSQSTDKLYNELAEISAQLAIVTSALVEHGIMLSALFDNAMKPKELSHPLEHVVRSNGGEHRIAAIPEKEFIRRSVPQNP